MWQKARFLPPTNHLEPFWVMAEPPKPNSLPALNDDGTGFESERIEGLWYKTNVLAPSGQFCMWAPQNGVELLSEFAEDVSEDDRYLLP